MKNTSTIEVNVSKYSSVETLKDSKTIVEILNEPSNSIRKARKNTVFRLLSKKKHMLPKVLIVYLLMAVVQDRLYTTVATISLDEDAPETSVIEDDHNAYNSYDSKASSPTISHDSHISLSMTDKFVKVDVTFEYLKTYFKHTLSMNSKPINIERVLSDICIRTHISRHMKVQ